jgi:hypothetical protein
LFRDSFWDYEGKNGGLPPFSFSRPLSREREAELAARIREGDIEARNELVQANLRFVVDVSKNYQNRSLSFSDLISVGNLGLLTAAERFDGTKGYKFISYAVLWIKQSILQASFRRAGTLHHPSVFRPGWERSTLGSRIPGPYSALRHEPYRSMGRSPSSSISCAVSIAKIEPGEMPISRIL